MAGLPERFPRTALYNRAAHLELALDRQIDITRQKIDDAEDMGLGEVTRKLAIRLQNLENAKEIAREARIAVYSCY